jgi:hypothetical protein
MLKKGREDSQRLFWITRGKAKGSYSVQVARRKGEQGFGEKLDASDCGSSAWYDVSSEL